MRTAGLEEAQAGIKIAGRNINNLRNADDTTPQAIYWEFKVHIYPPLILKNILFIWLHWVLVAAHGIFCCGM